MKSYSIFITLLLSFSLLCCNKNEDSTEVAVKIGAFAPDFNLSDVNGNFYKLSDFKGKYVVVDFWAAWCSVCRTENPKMQELYTQYQNKDVQFIGACLDANVDKWKQVVAEDGLTYLQLNDVDAFESKVAKTYGIQMVPFIMLLDESGKILGVSSRVADIDNRLAREL